MSAYVSVCDAPYDRFWVESGNPNGPLLPSFILDDRGKVALDGRFTRRVPTASCLVSRFRARGPMAKPTTVKIRLVSSADTGFFYVTKKNPRNTTEKMTMRKYDPVVRKHVDFKEAKIK